MKIFRLCALALFFYTGLHADENPTSVQAATQRFRDMLKTVDRIVLEQTYEPSFPEYTPESTLPELKDAAVIASLGKIIEFEKLDPACACEHTPEINFYQGKKLLFTLTLFEHRNLRCIDGPWSGDAVMTESSAIHFRSWFAEHGYVGFVREYDTMTNMAKEQAAQNDRFISLFPESIRPVLASGSFQSFVSKTDINVTEAVASFPSKKDLVLTCWRALGEIKTWDWDVNDAHIAFINAVLEFAEEQDIKAALNALSPDDSRAWAGAYNHYTNIRIATTNPLSNAVDNAWFVQLVQRAYRDGNAGDRITIVRDLVNNPNKTASDQLIAIAQTKPPFESASESIYAIDGYTYSPQSFALLALSELKVTSVKDIISQNLARPNGPGDTAALQVALAHFDGASIIRAEHFDHEAFGICDQAWRIVSSQPNFTPSLDFLARTVRAKSPLIRFRAKALLREKGLKPLSEEELSINVLDTPDFKSAKTPDEIERLIAEIKEKTRSSTNLRDQAKIESLHHRRAKILLTAGHIEEARADLKKAGYAPDTAIDRAFVEQTLGHFNEAAMVLRGSLPEEKSAKMVSAYLERCGYLCLARAKFEDAAFFFQATRSLPSDSNNPLLYYALCLFLAGKQEQLKIEEHELASDLALWPYNGLRMILGRTTEAEVINQIKASYRKDSEDLCEAHFAISVLRRGKNDTAGEREHLLAALTTKRYTSQAYSLATIRLREIETLATAKP